MSPLQLQQAKRLKSRKRRPEVDRLDGQWAQWLLGLMVNRLDVQEALMVYRLDG